MSVQVRFHEFVAGLANIASVSVKHIVFDEGFDATI